MFSSTTESDDPARDQLLRERRLLDQAMNQGEDLLSQVNAATTSLRQQGQTLFGTASRLTNNVLQRFPTINHWVERVRRRQRRDQIILAVQIGALVCFVLWYLFR